MSESTIDDVFKTNSSADDITATTSDNSTEAFKTAQDNEIVTACDSKSLLFNLSKILKLDKDSPINQNLHQFVFREHLVISDYQPQTYLSLNGASFSQQGKYLQIISITDSLNIYKPF